MDTIFALSSGLPPAGIGVIRISGPQAGHALTVLAGSLPVPRLASLRTLRDPASGTALDQALILWFPGPATATGEDLAECHVHGGRAVVAAVLGALGALDGLRAAEPGEFTRRAFEKGRIDLAQAEGLADLLAAETEGQRRSALALAEGALGVRVTGWQAQLLRASAQVEAELDFSDEGDVAAADVTPALWALSGEMSAMLAEPGAERLKDGLSVVLAGPPNAGKSSLINMLADRDAAIVSAIAGTTRDRIEVPIALEGLPLVLTDTAGLRETADEVESIGVGRAEEALARADIILWLGDAHDTPPDAILVAAKADLDPGRPGLPVSVMTEEGIVALKSMILERARGLLPKPGAIALHQRHRSIISAARDDLDRAISSTDLLITAEHLRAARNMLDRLTGKAGVEDMLDTLFGGMCIGK
jgi:tRNA modification GTPase